MARTMLIPIPSVIEPEETVCLSVDVPDTLEYKAMFWGVLQDLARWFTYARDDGHSGRLVAAVWQKQLQDAMERNGCEGMALIDVRQSEALPCKLEKTFDGETWEQFANLQLCPPRIRQNKGKLQWFDGTSWGDVPDGGDERYDGESEPQWTDPPPGQTGACLAGENLIASYVTMLTQTKSGLDAVATISGIVDIVAGYIGTQTLFPPALVVLNISIAIGSLAALGSEAIDGLIDSPNVDVLKCIINCHASSDGAFTVSEFDAIQDDIDLLIDNPEKLIMSEWLNSYGPVGMTRAAAANGIESGDCDCDCGWIATWGFVESENDWEAWNDGGGVRAIWSSGGWNENSAYKKSRLTIQLTGFDAAHILSVKVKSSQALTGNFQQWAMSYDGNDAIFVGSGPVVTLGQSTGTTTKLFLDIANDTDVNGTSVNGEVFEIEVRGDGPKPSQFP